MEPQSFTGSSTKGQQGTVDVSTLKPLRDYLNLPAAPKGKETATMTSSRLDKLIANAIKYHATVSDKTKLIRVNRRITDLIADRRDSLRLG